MGRLEGKIALITGAARGQGAAEGRLFSAEGAKVVVTDVLDDAGQATASEFGGAYLHHDVSSEREWEEVLAEVLKRHGRVDVLVNNAGIFETGMIADISLADYRRVIDVNQVGVFLGMKIVGAAMCGQRAGSIVNISSISGMRGFAGQVAYTSSKWAVRGMTKVAAREFGRFDVRVNSIHPGVIDTNMVRDMPSFDPDRAVAHLPIRRMGTAEDIASLALFLASDESGFCTGAEFVADGGATA